MVNAVEDRSSRTPTPTAEAVTQTRVPTATPNADIVDARGPAASAFRMISAVSGPGAASSNADSATQASKRPSSSNATSVLCPRSAAYFAASAAGAKERVAQLGA